MAPRSQSLLSYFGAPAPQKQSRSTMWTSKYAGELVGINSQFGAMSEWLAALERGDPECKPVMILAGPTGSGKTASAHKLLTQRGYRVIERHGQITGPRLPLRTIYCRRCAQAGTA